jgi:hypothetical protein
MLRHSDMVAAKDTKHLKSEARQLFLLDAACDAANAHFTRTHGAAQYATEPNALRASAAQGTFMLLNALSAPGDPMRMRDNLDKRVNAYVGQVIQRVAKLRKEAAAEEERQAARKQAAREAELREVEEAAAEAARKRKRASCRQMLVYMLLFGAAMMTIAGAAGVR